jgi:hypothetical protein
VERSVRLRAFTAKYRQLSRLTRPSSCIVRGLSVTTEGESGFIRPINAGLSTGARSRRRFVPFNKTQGART